MPTNLFPNVDFPVVTVQTTYNGADPTTVETKVTDKIEEAVSGVDGIDKLMSTSYEGFSAVTIQFKYKSTVTSIPDNTLLGTVLHLTFVY